MTTPLTSVFDAKAAELSSLKAPVSARLSMGADGQWLMTYSKDIGRGVPQPGSHKLYASTSKEGGMMLYMIPSNSNGKAYLITPNSIAGIQPLLDSYEKGSFRPTTVTVTNSSDNVVSSPSDRPTNNSINTSTVGSSSVFAKMHGTSCSVVKVCDRITPDILLSTASASKSCDQTLLTSVGPTPVVKTHSSSISTMVLSGHTKTVASVQNSTQYSSILHSSLTQPQSKDRPTLMKIQSSSVPVAFIPSETASSLTPQLPSPYIIHDSDPPITQTVYTPVVNNNPVMSPTSTHRTNIRITRPAKGYTESSGSGTFRFQTNSGAHVLINLPKTTSNSILSSAASVCSAGNTPVTRGNNTQLPYSTGASAALISLLSSANLSGVGANRVSPGIQSYNTTTCVPSSVLSTTRVASSISSDTTCYGTVTAMQNAPQFQDNKRKNSTNCSDRLVTAGRNVELEEETLPCTIKIDSVFSLVGSGEEIVKNSDTDTCSEDSNNEYSDTETDVNENNNSLRPNPLTPVKQLGKKRRKQKKQIEPSPFSGLRQILDSVECFVVLSRLNCKVDESDQKRVWKQKDWENIVPSCSSVCRENEVKRLMSNRIKRSIRIKTNLEKKQKIQSSTKSKISKGVMAGSPAEKIKLVDKISLNSKERTPHKLNAKNPITPCELEVRQQPTEEELSDPFLQSILHDHPCHKRPYHKQSVPKKSVSKEKGIDRSYIEKSDCETSRRSVSNASSMMNTHEESVILNNNVNIGANVENDRRTTGTVKILQIGGEGSSKLDNRQTSVLKKNAPISKITKAAPSFSSSVNPSSSYKIIVPPYAGCVSSTATSKSSLSTGSKKVPNIIPKDVSLGQNSKFVLVKMGEKSVLYPVLHNTVQPRAYTLDDKGYATILNENTLSVLAKNAVNKTVTGKLPQTPVTSIQKPREVISRFSGSTTTTTTSSSKQTVPSYSLAEAQVKKEPTTDGYVNVVSSPPTTINPLGVKIKTEPKKGYPDEMAEEPKSPDNSHLEKVALKRTPPTEGDGAHESKIKRLKEMLEQQERELEEFWRKQSVRAPVDLENI